MNFQSSEGLTQTSGPPAPLLDQNAVAKLLNCTTKFLEARRVRGGGPAFVRVGRLVRYRPSDLDQWIEARLATSTSDRAASR